MAAPDSNPPSIDPAGLRAAMGRFPTGVAVVAALTDDGPAGLAVNSVASLSLAPPLMLVCLDRGSRTLRSVESAGRFGINVLGADAEPVARSFARKVPVAEKWGGVDWAPENGVPRLEAAIVFIACTMRDVVSGGDHVIVTGEIETILERPGEPLLFASGAYRTFD
jgi:3-hydroxy-9,10-secoandrosta-1,3,5(10)-triene-9,17-dione monooxygenase reductase component